MRRIGALLSVAADNAGYQARVGAFRQRLALLGWTIGGNLEIDIRWGNANTAEIQRHAAELAVLAPDVILAAGTSTAGPLLQVTRIADELGGPQHRAACDWIAAGRQVNAIGAAGFGQGGIAVQRQAGAVAPRDRQQRSCERNLIDFG